jgi:hypothetical protein
VLLPRVMVERLSHVVLGRIVDVCEKIKENPSTSLRAKTFNFGKRALQLMLKKYRWDEFRDVFTVPRALTQEDA